MSSEILKGVRLIPFQIPVASKQKWIVLKIKNSVKKNFKDSLFKHSYFWKFLIIDSKFVSQNASHYYEKSKRRKKFQTKEKEKIQLPI